MSAGAARRAARRDGRVQQVGRLAARTLVILFAGGVVVLGATAVGYSPLGSMLPGSILSIGQQRQGPPTGAAPATTTAGTPDQARGGRGTGQPPPASTAAGGQGLFSGRNAPSLQSGLRQEWPYLAISAAVCAFVALLLRVVRPRRRRSAQRGGEAARDSLTDAGRERATRGKSPERPRASST